MRPKLFYAMQPPCIRNTRLSSNWPPTGSIQEGNVLTVHRDDYLPQDRIYNVLLCDQRWDLWYWVRVLCDMELHADGVCEVDDYVQ